MVRYHLIGMQRFIAIVAQLLFSQVCLGHLGIGSRRLNLRLVGSLINHKQHLPTLHLLALFHTYLAQVALNTRDNLHALSALNLRGVSHTQRYILFRNLHRLEALNGVILIAIFFLAVHQHRNRYHPYKNYFLHHLRHFCGAKLLLLGAKQNNKIGETGKIAAETELIPSG